MRIKKLIPMGRFVTNIFILLNYRLGRLVYANQSLHALSTLYVSPTYKNKV